MSTNGLYIARGPESAEQIVCIIGARTSRAHDGVTIGDTLSDYDPKETVIIAGGIIGIESLAARLARDMGFRVHTVLSGQPPRLVDPEWETYASTWEQLPITTDLTHRSEHILRRMEEYENSTLIAFPAYGVRHQFSKQSGTWRMIERAQSSDVGEIRIIVLNESGEV